MGHKFSRYAILSNGAFADNQGDRWRMVYATRTGSVVPLTDELAAAVRDRDDAALCQLDEPTLKELLDLELVVPAEEDERRTVVARQRSASADLSDLLYTLLPSSYCNMGCSYCGQQHTKGRLGTNHRDAVVARLTSALARPGTRSMKINWFGAEPLMGYAIIRDISKRVIPVADRVGVNFHALMVTNGSLLTVEKIRRLHHECRVRHFEITLDGPARVHDRHRPLKSGAGSFERIVHTLSAALQEGDLHGVQFGLRTNIDVENADYVDEYLETLVARGLAHRQVTVSLHSIHSWGNDVSATQIRNVDMADRLIGWVRHATRLGINVKLLPGAPRGAVCSAVTTAAEVISSSGNVFSCTEYPLVPEAEQNKALGHVSAMPNQSPRPLGDFDDWHEGLSRKETPCGDCQFLPVCGGCCPKLWREGEWPCPDYKFNAPKRLDVLAEMNGFAPVS